MNTKYIKLFEPGKIGNLIVKNRIVQSPMHSKNCEGFEMRYSHWYTEYFRERAKGGVGLIITGHVKAEKTIDPYPINSTFPCIDSDLAIRDFNEVTETVHLYGAKIALQLSAGTGRLADIPQASRWPAAPSTQPLFFHKNLVCRELTRGEINGLVQAYGYAAGRAKRAGFDALYIHAHSYLIDQFLSTCWNQREDEYGGSLDNRMRFFCECLQSARNSLGNDFPIIVGIGLEHGFEGGRKLEETIEIAKRMQNLGVNAFHLREGCYDVNPPTMPTSYMGDAISVPNAAKVRANIGIPVIVDGALGSPDLAEKCLVEKKIDFVGLARPLLVDPEWPKKVREGRTEEIRPCIRCMECLHRVSMGKFIGCSVNGRVGREREAPVGHATSPRKVLVIGGGPGGMEVARIAARRGHRVTLVEKNQRLGGNLLEACAPKFKKQLLLYRQWLERDVRSTETEIILGKEVDNAFVNKMNPDVVMVGTGTHPCTPDVPGALGKNVIQAVDYLREQPDVGAKVVIIGGGLVGCETAVCLADKAESVTIIEMLPEILMTMTVYTKYTLMELMVKANVKWETGLKLLEINGKGVTALGPNGDKRFFPADTVILSTGFSPNDKLYKSLEKERYEVYAVGDCQGTGKIFNAISVGYSIAKEL